MMLSLDDIINDVITFFLLFHKSLNSNVFLTAFKIDSITALFKSGYPKIVFIALLPYFPISKLF